MRRVPRTSLECALAGFGALAILAWWLADAGGYFQRAWLAGAIAVAVLLAFSVAGMRDVLAAPTGPTRLALVALSAHVAWSFASLLWADDPGAALAGSQRSLLYLLVFTLFALLPWAPGTARAGVLGFLVVAFGADLVTVLRLLADGATGSAFADGQLQAPLGYHNATAALSTMAALPALALAADPDGRRRLRAVLPAAAALALGLAVMTQSRGWLFTLPVVAVAALLCTRERLRLVAFATPPLAAVALAAPTLLAVHRAGTGLAPGAATRAMQPALDDALLALGLVAVGVLAVTVLLLACEGPFADRLRPGVGRRVGRGLAAGAVALALVGGVVVSDSHPVDRAQTAWSDFKAGGASGGEADRFADISSSRYDFWRVGVTAWADHPLQGLGQDNFADVYARDRHNAFETPRWVHSLPLRVLVHTGLVGAILLAVFAVALLRAAGRARAGGHGAVTGLAALPLLVWVLHGSVDWFWEFPALSAPAFAFAGMLCALGPAAPAVARTRAEQRRVSAVAVAGLAAVVAVALPALAASTLTGQASQHRGADFTASLDRLRDAAALNPLASQPWVVAGEIEVAHRRLAGARRAFGRAAARDRAAWYPQLALGLVAGEAKQPRLARRHLLAALRRNPLQPTINEALRRAGSASPMTFRAARAELQEELDKRRNAP